MKQASICIFVLLLTTGLAWAEETAAATIEPGWEGGDCTLPDLTGMSDDEIEAAALAAGLGVEPTQAAVPACPTPFRCSSIVNCAAGSVCSLTDIGPCCTPSSGLQVCCISGTFKVERCPCECTGNPCALTCIESDNVRRRCS